MERFISVIKKIREIKVSNDLKPNAPLTVLIRDLNNQVVPVNENLAAMMEKMAKAQWVSSLEGDLTVQPVTGGSLFIPAEQLLDRKAEIEKLTAEAERLSQEVARSNHILSNQGFLSKAPEAKVNLEKQKLADYEKQLAVVKVRLEELSK